MIRQFALQEIGQNIAGVPVDPLRAGDDDRVLLEIGAVVACRIGLRLRRHDEQHDIGILYRIGLRGVRQGVRQPNTGKSGLVQAIGLQVRHQGGVAPDQCHLVAAGRGGDGGERRAEGAGADDGDPLVSAHALAPRLP
jgi:hypothetical protein